MRQQILTDQFLTGNLSGWSLQWVKPSQKASSCFHSLIRSQSPHLHTGDLNPLQSAQRGFWNSARNQKKSCATGLLHHFLTRLQLILNVLATVSEPQSSLFHREARRFPVLPVMLLQEACCGTKRACYSSWRLINKVAEQQHRCWLRSLSWRDELIIVPAENSRGAVCPDARSAYCTQTHTHTVLHSHVCSHQTAARINMSSNTRCYVRVWVVSYCTASV